MTNSNLYKLFFDRFPNDASAVFLEMPDGRKLSYKEMHHETGCMLGLLREKGVKKDDRVVVQLDKSIESVLLYLACLRAGAVYVPLNTAYTPAEVSYFLEDASPQLFVCSEKRKKELKKVADSHDISELLTYDVNGRGSLLAELSLVTECDEIAEIQNDDLAAILYTSGTTGRSKGAMLSHANLSSNALALYDYWHWQHDDVLLHALPVFHVHGLFVALHCALLGGSKVLFLSRFDVDTVIDKLPSATVMMGVPTFYTRLLERKDFTRELCCGMRLFISGSAPLLAETHGEFEQRSGHKILERYGMTETGMLTSNPYSGERVAGTVGFALPGICVRVAGNDGTELTAGEAGILEVKGPNVFSGYWNLPEKTAEEFRADGWFITGDIAEIDDQGRVTLVGRAKDLIITGGYNVYPKEVEDELNRLPGVRESAVIAVPHNDFGEAVVAVIVEENSSESQSLQPQAIKQALINRLARFKLPKKVIVTSELPRNTMGKVQKNILRDKYKELFQ